jgi:hypothetical protein
MPIYYKVVRGYTAEMSKFEEEVAGYFVNGYIPAGGVCVYDGQIFQAVARNTDMGPAPGTRPQSIPTRPQMSEASYQSAPSTTPR